MEVVWRFGNQKNTGKRSRLGSTDDRAEGQEVVNPHYFYVPRKADWDNQVYALSGGFSKDITNHLSVAVKANYGTEKFSRTLDARSQITNRNLGGEMQIG